MTVSRLISFLTISSLAVSYELKIGVIEKGAISSTCQVKENCTFENSECIENFCDCREGYVIDGSLTKCLKVATTYNDECKESVQCSKFLSIGGTCQSGVCVCADGYHYLHGFCHLSKGLNEPCEKNDDCFVNTDYAAASCVEGVCKCSKGFYQREYSTCRRNHTVTRRECDLDSDCTSSESTKCIHNKCFVMKAKGLPQTVTSNETFEDDEEIELADEVKIGSDCEIDDDCKAIGSGHCSLDKKCACNRAYFPSSDNASCIPEIGESCVETEVPAMPKTQCQDGQWTCDAIYVGLRNNRLCRKMLRAIGEKCMYSEQCQLFGPRAKCVENACVCDKASHWVVEEKFCWLSKKVKEFCESDYDCHQPEGSPEVTCKSNGGEKRFCTCPEGTHDSVDKEYCVKDAPELGSYCRSNKDCGNLANVLCSKKKCQCKANHLAIEGTCSPGLNATCQTQNDCKQANTFCANETQTCQCSEDYVPVKSHCVKKSLYQQPCTDDLQCSAAVANSYCKDLAEGNGHCECLSKYFYNQNSCYKRIGIGEKCTNERECFIQDSKAVCRNGICSCEFGFAVKREQCVDASSAASVTNAQTWLLLPSIAYLTMKALR